MARFVGLWLLVRVGPWLPLRLLYVVAAVAGTAAWYLSRAIREATTDHMRHVLGVDAPQSRIDAFARRCARSAAYYYADFAHYRRLPPARLFERVDDVRGLEHLLAAYDRGRGVILASAHLGNPEVISQALGPFGLNLAVITEPLHPRSVHDLVHDVRARFGVCYLPATPRGLRDALLHLRRGGTLGLLVDRDVLGTGVPWPFFGERTTMPGGAVELARRTGAALVLGSALRSGPGQFRVILEEVVLPGITGDRAADFESGMAAVVPAVERLIRRDPGQWFPLLPVWRGIPSGARVSGRKHTGSRAVQSER
jgi:lauroyl/myristoyl acyltransferase